MEGSDKMKRQNNRLWIMLLIAMIATVPTGCGKQAANETTQNENIISEGNTQAPDEAAAVSSDVNYADDANWAYFRVGEGKDADLFLICPTVDMNDEYNMSLDDEDTKASFTGALNMERGIYEDDTRLSILRGRRHTASIP